MRFRPDGLDIPNGLVEAQERGEVVFLCGAGVSFAAGLPSFKGLVDSVYASLNEQIAHYPIEKQAYDERAFDRVLGLLTRRIGEQDAHEAPLVKREIRKAVKAALTTARQPLSFHAALLQLSRNVRQETCLITTNFDTLFEESAKYDLKQPLESHASQALPGPQTERFAGVLHLHGRLENKSLDLGDTDLVLTSAEFAPICSRDGPHVGSTILRAPPQSCWSVTPPMTRRCVICLRRSTPIAVVSPTSNRFTPSSAPTRAAKR